MREKPEVDIKDKILKWGFQCKDTGISSKQMAANEASPANKVSDVERVVIRLEDIRPHMNITFGFVRFHVAETMARMFGGKRADHDRAASRILAKARKEGLIRFSDGRARSTCYVFTDV